MRHGLPTPLIFDSAFARVDPRWKLAGILIAVALTAALQSIPAVILALVLAIALALIARLPPMWLISRLSGPALFLAAFTLFMPFLSPAVGPVWTVGPVSMSAHGAEAAIRIWCKALTIMTLVLVLIGSSPLHVIFQAAHHLRVPGIVVQLAALSHRYVYVISSELGRLRTALRVRGYRNRPSLHCYRTVGNVAGIVLVRGIERADRVSQAMRCRGFDGRFRSLTAFRTRAPDVICFLLLVFTGGILLAFDVIQR